MLIHRMVATSLSFALTAGAAIAGGVVEVPPEIVVIPEPVPTGSFYGALSFGGMHLESSITQEIDPGDDYYQGKFEFGQGMGLLGAVGYDFGNGFRVELELSQFHGETGDLNYPDAIAPFDVEETDGDFRLTSGMINGWYTFGEGSVRPFVGAGLGMMHASIDTEFTLLNNNGISDTASAMAYMVGVGAEIPMSDTMSIIASYRYLTADGFEMTCNEGTDIELADFDSHVLTVGAMFRF